MYVMMVRCSVRSAESLVRGARVVGKNWCGDGEGAANVKAMGRKEGETVGGSVK